MRRSRLPCWTPTATMLFNRPGRGTGPDRIRHPRRTPRSHLPQPAGGDAGAATPLPDRGSRTPCRSPPDHPRLHPLERCAAGRRRRTPPAHRPLLADARHAGGRASPPTVARRTHPVRYLVCHAEWPANSARPNNGRAHPTDRGARPLSAFLVTGRSHRGGDLWHRCPRCYATGSGTILPRMIGGWLWGISKRYPGVYAAMATPLTSDGAIDPVGVGARRRLPLR